MSSAGLAWEQLHLMKSPSERRKGLSFAHDLGVTTDGITPVHGGLCSLRVMLCCCAGTGQFCELTAGNDERLGENDGAYT